MNSESALAKRELRQKLRALLETIPTADSAAAFVEAQDQLSQQSVWRNAQSVLFYAPLPGEIDLTGLLKAGLRDGKKIALPRFMEATGSYEAFQVLDLDRDCAPGKFGISEPAAGCASFPLKQLDLVLVPGVGFDAAGFRLGRGRGFYDRLLAHVGGIKCGVAFDQQIVARIPGEQHDVRMNFILTPTRWLEVPE